VAAAIALAVGRDTVARMSDDYILVIPRDPRYVPTLPVQRRVVELLAQLAPGAEDITAETSEEIRFFDCGENFERIGCPKCAGEIDLEWWHARMDADAQEGGFRLARYSLPCCGASVTLNDLEYDWPQAFGRFLWEVRNPDIGELTRAIRAELEVAADAPLVFVRQRL
jgi:hypothetical protein